jgi:hypothetical protein
MGKESYSPQNKYNALTRTGLATVIGGTMALGSDAHVSVGEPRVLPMGERRELIINEPFSLVGRELPVPSHGIEARESLQTGRFEQGFAYIEFGYQGLGEDIPGYRREVGNFLDRMKQNGANSVSYITPYFQDGPYDNSMYIDPVETPNAEVIRAFVQEAHERDMAVIMRPFMHLRDNSQFWRGQIQPTDPEAWFRNHEQVMDHFLAIAQAEGVEYFSYGSELTSMENPAFTDNWEQIFSNAREEYNGKLMFSTNWGATIYGNGINRELMSSPNLDIIGLSYYYEHPQVPSGGPKEALVASMNNLPVQEMVQMHEETNMPIMIVEIGATSIPQPWAEPWNTPNTVPYESDQALYFDAACEAVVNNEQLPFVVGMQIWQVEAGSPYLNPAVDTTFDPTNKAAEVVIAECFNGNLQLPR